MTNTKSILLVEDDQFLTDLYQKQFESMGYTLDVALDGKEGKKKLKDKTYDLLLLDIMLPGMNGLELLKKWKEEHPNSKMPVVLLTNLGQDQIVKEAFQLGATAYFVKSAHSLDQITQSVKQILDEHQT